MILKLKLPLLLLITSVLLFSCQKEYSLEGKLIGGTAVFTLAGAPGACISPVITGTYAAGTALAATNLVTLAVNVTTAGTYTISTPVVNGISFSGTGTFASTGAQTIVLTGSGTPATAGTIAYTPGTTGCAFSIIITGGGGSGGTAVFTLNGAPGTCTGATTGGTYAAGTALTPVNFVRVGVNVTTIGTYTISTNILNGISFSGTGTFTATGAQIIQLNGSGTPLLGGSFNYMPGTNGCMFSITVTGSSTGTSVFTYAGGTGICTGAVPAGTYAPGTALSATNTVVISVNVTTIGTYSITTPVVNGYSFAGTGSFAAAGTQTVTLTGTGTPVVAGIDNFTPAGGCSFPITVVGGTVVTDFLRCKIDGVLTNFNADLLGELISPDTIDITGAVSTATNSPVFGIELVKPTAITTGTYARFLVTTNTTTFSLAVYDDGVTATPWITGIVPLTAPFSVIVTSYTTNPNRITGTFTGTIYSDPIIGTGPRLIAEGAFSLPYQ